jgi:hypothetical protein
MSRNDRDEKRALLDLATDLLIPGVASPKLALVEPDFDAAGPQRLTNAPRRFGVLRGVT